MTNYKKVGPIAMDYTYNYKNLSFGQGNQGTIRYLSHWKRTPQPADPLNDTKITTYNMAL